MSSTSAIFVRFGNKVQPRSHTNLTLSPSSDWMAPLQAIWVNTRSLVRPLDGLGRLFQLGPTPPNYRCT